PVDEPNKFLDVAGRVPVTNFYFVLFRVEVFLAARTYWHILTKLKTAVDTAQSGERRGKEIPHFERGLPTLLQIFMEDVRRVGEEVAPKIIFHLGRRQLGGVFGEFFLGITPGEVSVGLREAYLGQCFHHRRPRECFGEEDY